MNKLFTKIAMAFIGASMAIGVGVAIGTNKEATRAEAAGFSGTYNLVTSKTGIAAGDTVLIAKHISSGDSVEVLSAISTTSTKYGKYASVSVSSGTITLDNNTTVAELIVETGYNSTGFSFKGNANNPATISNTQTQIGASSYITHTGGNSNHLNINGTKDAKTSWTLDSYAANSGMTIKNNNTNTRVLRFNTDRFACYTNSTGVLVDIYKKASASYTVTYNPVSSSGTGTGTMSNGTGAKVTIAESTFTAPSGKIFKEWNDKSDGTGNSYDPGDIVEKDLNLYAVWVTKRSVTYHPNSSEGDSDYVTYFPDGTDVTLASRSDAGFTVPGGKAFNGWNTNSSGTGTQKAAGDVMENQTSNLEFFAQWVDLFTVTYNGNGNTGGSVPTDSNEYGPDDEVTVKTNSGSLVKTGFNFYGWNTSSDGTGTHYAPNDTFNISESVTLYAQWVALENSSTTFTAGTETGTHTATSSDSGEETLTKNSITFYCDNGAFNVSSGSYRIYKNSVSTFTAPTGKRIGKIVFTCDASGTSQYGPGCFVLTSGNGYYSYSGSTGTLFSNSASVSLTASSAQVRASVVTVTLVDNPDITISGPTSVKAGSTITLTSDVVGVTWTSSNTEVATVVAATATTATVTGVAYNASAVTITASKTGYDSDTHSVTVNYADVTSISLNLSSTSIGLTGEVDLEATVLSDKANPGVTWAVSSEDFTEDVDFEYISIGKDFTLSMDDENENTGTITVTATAVGYIDDTQTPDLRATCVITVEDTRSVSLSVDSMSGYAGSGDNHKASITATANNFTSPTYSWSVVSYTVEGMVTFSASTSATTYVNFVKAGTATIKCGVQEGGAGDYVYSDTITVTVSADAVSAVYWSGEDITYYSGSTLTASDIEDWIPYYTMDSGDLDVITDNYIIKLNGTAYTLGTALTAGIYTVTLTYGGKTTTTNNPTLTVIQQLNTINKDSHYSYTFPSKQFSDNTNATLGGKSWTLAGSGGYWGYTSAKGQQLGSEKYPYSSATLTSTEFSGTITSITVNVSGGKDVDGTVGITVGGSAFGGSAKAISDTATEYTFTGSASGTIVITISQTTSVALYIKSIAVFTNSDIVNIANSASHFEAQAAVVEFAQYMNEQMNGTKVCSGDMSNLGTAWANVADKYDTLFSDGKTELDSDELAYAKDMLANATASWNEEHDSDEKYCLERAMATYEWCVSHYSSTCTAFMSAVRPIEANHTNPILSVFKADSANLATVMIVISMITATAIGGYFFLKKRKEER